MMVRRISVFLACSLLLASTALAQLSSQTALVGTVADSQGAVLPGAQVVAVNVGTKDTYETTTNDEGYFNIQFVKPGIYEITVTMTGFQTAKTTGIEVGNNQVVRANASLSPGGVVETVVVDARPPVLNTDSAAVAETINARAIKDLPVAGRNVWSLASTTPGVLTGLNSDIGLSFRGAGQREIQNSLSLDGINASSNLLAATSMRPISDAVTEVQVQTGSASAEYGSYLGVSINVVTKSGTNNLHGSASHYYQGEKLDARGYFENRANPKNPRKRNQFSFEADGPFIIPGMYDGHDKTFFMAAYEGIRSEAQTSVFATVPTALMRQGNFSEVTTAIKNPFTQQNFAGNIIPNAMISPTALKLLRDYYPEPNRAGLASNLQATRFSKDDADQLLLRGDQNLSNTIRMYVRYNYFDTYSSNLEAVPATSVTQPRTNHNTLVTYTHTLRPTLFNDFRIGYHRIDFDTLNYFEVNDIGGAGTSLGIPGFDGDTRFQNAGIPSINITSFSGLGGGGTNWYQFDTTFQMSNVLAYSRGSHNVRTGFDLRRMATGRRAANDPRGRFDFTGAISNYSVADFMLGLPRTVINPTDQIQGHVGQWRNGFFVNDIWQVTQDLTFSLGMRYEMNTPVQTYEGLASMLDESFERIIPTSFPAKGFEFTEANKKDFAPRLGATYRLGEKMVVRAGYGIYFNPNQMNSFTFLTNNPPIAAVSTFTSDPANPTLSFTQPTGVATVITPDMISPTRKLPNARKDQWNVDLQRELGSGMAIDFQYLGSNTQHLDRSFFNNTPQPGQGAVDPRRPSKNFRSRRIITNDLIADYDSVSVILRKRMSHGLQLDTHYTWSRTRDMATHSNGGGQTMNNYDIWADYGPAIWDIPHRFVASYIYDLPFFRTSPNAVLRNVVGGWQLSGITTIQSGSPVNVTVPGDPANIGISNLQRPNLVGAIPTLNCQDNATSPEKINCFDASAFANPTQFTFGNLGRNALRGPKWVLTDISFAKILNVHGNTRLELRADVFNLFNHANLGNPNASFGSASFGRISGLATGANMRQVQLGARFMF